MPELTGVPVLDFFLLIGALGLAAAGAFGSVMRFLELFRPAAKDEKDEEPQFGRRQDDVASLDKRVALVEQEQEFTKERHDELKGEVRLNRSEQKKTAEAMFTKLDDMTKLIVKAE